MPWIPSFNGENVIVPSRFGALGTISPRGLGWLGDIENVSAAATTTGPITVLFIPPNVKLYYRPEREM